MRPAGRKRMPTTATVTGAIVSAISLLPTASALELLGQEDRFGHILHRLAVVHARLLDTAESFLLADVVLFHEHALGFLDHFARGQMVFQVLDARLHRLEFLESAEGNLNGRLQITGPPRLRHVMDHPDAT